MLLVIGFLIIFFVSFVVALLFPTDVSLSEGVKFVVGYLIGLVIGLAIINKIIFGNSLREFLEGLKDILRIF